MAVLLNEQEVLPPPQPADDPRREADLIMEALVREMGRATRWTAVKDVWQAMINVRRMADSMGQERDYLALVRNQSERTVSGGSGNNERTHPDR